METFPILKRKDIAAHGEYRTRRVILELYDGMAQAERTGIAYTTRLNPRRQMRGWRTTRDSEPSACNRLVSTRIAYEK